jgi:hypothetical protein
VLTEPEVYKKAFWSDLPKRSRGRKDHPAARVKAAFSDYIRKHPELSSSAKLVGGLITSWYSESRGYAWPSNSAMAEDLGLGVRTVRMATGELHERGLIHKVEGGGWDRRRVRHISNQYYPAFSMVLNQDNGAIIKNAPYLCQESPETRSNLRKYPAESAPRPRLAPEHGGRALY